MKVPMHIEEHYPSGWLVEGPQLQHSYTLNCNNFNKFGEKTYLHPREIQFLTRQGIALHNHNESEGNLHHLSVEQKWIGLEKTAIPVTNQ